MRDVRQLIRLERATVLRNGKISSFAIFEEREGGSNTRPTTARSPRGRSTSGSSGEAAGSSARPARTADSWTPLRPIDTVWPPKVRIGVAAINNTDATFTVRYEDPVLKVRSAGGAGGLQ